MIDKTIPIPANTKADLINLNESQSTLDLPIPRGHVNFASTNSPPEGGT